jgi:hypothetical protein
LLDLAAQNGDSSVLKDAKARKSLRQKALHKCYKNSPCSNKNCLGCSLDPPTLSPSVIKNLGATFCNINPDKLAVENLSKARNKKAAAPGGRSKPKAKAKSILTLLMMTARQQARKSPRRTEWISSLFCLCERIFILRACNIHTLKLSFFCGRCPGLFATMAASQPMWNLFYLLVSHE